MLKTSIVIDAEPAVVDAEVDDATTGLELRTDGEQRFAALRTVERAWLPVRQFGHGAGLSASARRTSIALCGCIEYRPAQLPSFAVGLATSARRAFVQSIRSASAG